MTSFYEAFDDSGSNLLKGGVMWEMSRLGRQDIVL